MIKIKKKLFFILLLPIITMPLNINAARGCCSWHGGISHCGSNGYYICNDGTQSPSCTCFVNNNNNYQNNNYQNSNSDCYCSVSDIRDLNDEIDALETEIDILEEDIQNTENKLGNYQFLFWGTLITFGIYIFYKNYNNSVINDIKQEKQKNIEKRKIEKPIEVNHSKKEIIMALIVIIMICLLIPLIVLLLN